MDRPAVARATLAAPAKSMTTDGVSRGASNPKIARPVNTESSTRTRARQPRARAGSCPEEASAPSAFEASASQEAPNLEAHAQKSGCPTGFSGRVSIFAYALPLHRLTRLATFWSVRDELAHVPCGGAPPHPPLISRSWKKSCGSVFADELWGCETHPSREKKILREKNQG